MDADNDGYLDWVDCDDTNPSVHPGAEEVCANSIDDDCDPATLDAFDGDGDGVTCDLDCEDDLSEAYPGAPEICGNGIDDDCDPSTPDVFDGDSDGDACVMDCDDADPAVGPSQAEVCANSIDDDCELATLDAYDLDGDGSTCDLDCDDQAPAVYPGAPETCGDGVDDDCNGSDEVCNVAPVAVDDTDEVDSGDIVTLDVIANDTDPDDGIDPASVVVIDAPTEGTLTVNGDGTIDYEHTGIDGEDSFTYQVSDYSGDASNVATVTVTSSAPSTIIGDFNFLGLMSLHDPNFLVGTRDHVPSTYTLTHLSVLSFSSAGSVQLVLYDDNVGNPGAPVAWTDPTPLTSSRQEIPVVSQVTLTPGDSYIMGVYDQQASIGYTSATADVVWYRGHTFGAAAPFWPAWSTYNNQRFNYYMILE